ncbi:hypothetical protein KBD69_05235 [Candidatus Woesebacteria bacterium]|nr:hypothetical protein [Candidatus Woesebacteria bacterium]
MSKYTQALELAKPSLVMQRQLFEKYLQPVSGVPVRQFLEYFYHQGYQAWRYGVKENDLKNVQFVESICSELYFQNHDEFLQIASLVMQEANSVSDILQESERRYFEAEEDDGDARIKSALDHYKTFFEGSLRLWATIPYFYSVRKLGTKSKAKQPDGFLRVSAGVKYQSLKERTLFLKEGRLSDLVDLFSSDLRNAGGGHDSYEFLDDGGVKLHITNPYSGKSRELVTDYSEIKESIDSVRKAIWILKNGFMVFLNKNPKILEEVSRTQPLKLREIQTALSDKVDEFWMNLLDFKFDSHNGELTLRLEKSKRIRGRSSELLFSTGERFEVITIATEVRLENQLFGIIQLAVWLMSDHYPLKRISLVFLDEEGKQYQVTYLPDMVKRSKKSEGVPKPLSGQLPVGKYDIRSEISVPYGFGKIMEQQMKNKGYRVI